MKAQYQKLISTLLVAVLSCAVVFALDGFDFMHAFELMTLDFRYKYRPDVPVEERLGYIEFDDDSIALYGKWPWSRSYQTYLVEILALYKAKSAGYDVFFVEKEGISLTPKQIRSASLFDLKDLLKDRDAEFASAIKKANNIYLAYYAVDPSLSASKLGLEGIKQETKRFQSEHSPAKKDALTKLSETFLPLPEGADKNMFKSVDIDPPVLQLLISAKGIGFAQPSIDIDSIVRNYHLFKYYDEKALYPITLAMLSDILDFKLSEIQAVIGSHITLKNALLQGQTRKDIQIPIDNHYRMLVNWAGRFNDKFLHIPFHQLMRFYAYELAKAQARQMPASADFYMLKGGILKAIDTRQIVPISEADKIASEIAVATLATRMAAQNPDLKQITKSLSAFVKPELASEVVLSVLYAMKLTGNDKVKLDEVSTDKASKTLQITQRYIDWYSKHNALAQAKPYYFPPAAIVNHNAKKIEFLPIDLEGKIFMIGLTGEHTIDLNATPFESSSPMVSLHLNVLNTVLTESFLTKTPEYYKYVFAIVLSLLVSFCTFYLPSYAGFISLFVLGLGYLSTYFLWSQKGQWYPWVVPMSSLVLAFVLALTVQFVKAYREKRKVRSIFSAMVSPAVLKVMEENPDKFTLTGQRKRATMMFSKIDGISDVVKTLSPEELTRFLSIYLTPCSEIIMAYDGYIDKYEGHVIMADFGVPLDDPNNAQKCAFACIEQLEDIKAFKSFVTLSYGLEVNVSIGFNHGYVSAGNMGSERKFQYTVMGDPVNVSARFMAANYIYNTMHAITGQDTVPVIKDYVYLRLLDKLLLKGKTVPTAIYDVLGWRTDAYLMMMKGKPLPEFLFMNWTHCPAMKMPGYLSYWQEVFKKTNHALAKKIADFFASQLPLAQELTALQYCKEIIELQLKTTSTVANPLALQDWLSSVRQSLQANEDHHLADRVNTLRTFLVNKSSHEFLANSFEILTQKFNTLTNLTDVDKLIEALSSKYKRAVKDFYNSIKNLSGEYHEMMAYVCTPHSDELKSATLYEEAFELYQQRQWDLALLKLKEALLLTQNKNPIKAFMQRIEDYKLMPPSDNWQGEFVQTKK